MRGLPLHRTRPGYARREYWAVFSPDDRWIAYTSDVSGQDVIYVQRYPEGAKRVVSFEGGELSVWNQSGGEVFYQRSSNVYAVRIVNGARVGTATVLFQRPDARDRNWDVAPDGRKFLVAEDIRPAQINIVQNWFEELKAKVPRKSVAGFCLERRNP